MTNTQKRCPSCSKRAGYDVYKIIEDFSKAKGKKDGREANCRVCVKLSRSISLSLAREDIALQRFKEMAAGHFKGKIDASGYAVKPAKEGGFPRLLNVLLSDLHIGAYLGRDNPELFGPEEESRRFAKIVAEVCDWKPQYRSDTKLNVYLNGDLIDGLLLHDLRDGKPLTEQVAAFWTYMSKALALWSKVFPSVHVEFQPGNHGRNITRHPGRATSMKWDGEETKMIIGLQMMSSDLKNVSFHGCGITHKLAFSNVLLPGGHYLGLTHGDTEVKLGDPDTRAKDNIHELGSINASLQYGKKCDVFAIGHFHKARIQYPRGFNVIWNAALVPPNGHARTAGYGGRERCGQFIWESVAGYPVGDVRFLEVGASEDKDKNLNKIIPAFGYED
jgi:hypothetical protein